MSPKDTAYDPIADADTPQEEVSTSGTQSNTPSSVNPAEWPRRVGELTFHTPAELEEYVKKLRETVKTEAAFLKGKKPKAVSQKTKSHQAMADFINANMPEDLKAILVEVKEDFPLRLRWYPELGQVGVPVTKQPTRSSNGTGGGAQPLIVDETEYPSAKKARDTLHPDMKEKSQNRETIIKYLRGQKHAVEG